MHRGPLGVDGHQSVADPATRDHRLHLRGDVHPLLPTMGAQGNDFTHNASDPSLSARAGTGYLPNPGRLDLVLRLTIMVVATTPEDERDYGVEGGV